MRVNIDRGADAVHFALTEAPQARRVDVAEGVVLAYDAAGRIVGIEIRGVDPVAWHDFTVELAGFLDRPLGGAAATRSAPQSALPPQPTPYGGPLTWEPEAEAAMLQAPFFNRGRLRLAASALARKRGQDRVTIETVQAVGR